MHLNIKGLRSKMEELQVTLKERNIDICSVNETFLKPKIKVDIPGYHLIRKDRSTGKGGGVAFLIKSDIKFEEIELNIQNNSNIEYKAIVINNSKMKDLIVCTYFSPRGHTYRELLINLKTLSDNIILLGDLMQNILHWDHQPLIIWGKNGRHNQQ